MRRALWNLTYMLFFRFSPARCYGYRRILLRLFGCRISSKAGVRPSAKIIHPWKLSIDDHAMIGDHVTVYNLGQITIGRHTIISQNVHLCAGTHDYRDPRLPLDRSTIQIGCGVWVCADAFIGPNVVVGNNAVVGARAVVIKNIEANVVVAGNPAKTIRKRITNNDQDHAAVGPAEDKGTL